MGRHALLVATGRYSDPKLSSLRAPSQDVARLGAVLGDPARGDFDVTVLRDAPDHEIRSAVDNLLSDRFADDVVLLYLSCHGLVTQHGRLYFASTNTRHDRPGSSAVSRSFVNEQFEDCHAGARILLLDCCFSGAFGEGFKAGSVAALDGRVGKGYVVMTACDVFEYAYEVDGPIQPTEQPTSSIFTDVLVEGLATGAADRDGDGWVAADELFRYVHDAVVRRRPEQRPRFFALGADSHIYLAKVPTGAARPRGPAGEAVADAAPAGSRTARRLAAAEETIAAVAKPVARTLGPLGSRVAVPDGRGGFVETDDVLTIVTRLESLQPRTAPGVGYLRELVESVEREAADGTATAVVLARHLVAAVADPSDAAAQAEPWHVKRGLDLAAERVAEALAGMAREIERKADVAAVVQTCTGDRVLSELVAEAFDKVGKDGAVDVEAGRAAVPELELEEGFRFGGGYRSARFVSRLDSAEAVLDDPYLLIVDDELEAMEDLLPIMEFAVQSGRALVVIAAAISGSALAVLTENHVRGVLRAVAVAAPDAGAADPAAREALLEDLGLFTGGVVLGRRHGLDLHRADLAMLGRARRVVVGRGVTLVVEGHGDPDQLTARVRQLRREAWHVPPGPEREALLHRLSRLTGYRAILRFGPPESPEASERRRRAVRAIRVTREATEHGIVPGGGTALTVAARAAAESLDLTGSERHGADLLVQALTEPARHFATAAGLSPGQGLDRAVDAVTRRHVDPWAAGIVDSVHVLRTAVAAAVTLAGRLLMLEVADGAGA